MTFARRAEQFIKWKFLSCIKPRIARKQIDPSRLGGKDIRQILVIRSHDQLGDFLLSTPALRAVTNRFPNAEIDIVVRSYCADVMKNHPLIRDVIVFHERLNQWTFARTRHFLRQFKRKWDLTIVLSSESHSLSSDLLASFSKAAFILGSEHRLFPGTDRNFCYNLIAPDSPPDSHQSRRNVDIVRYIGGDTDDLSEFIHITESEKSELRNEYKDFYDSGNKIIGLHIGANKSENRWPPEKFAALAKLIENHYKAGIIIFWGPREFDLAERFGSVTHLKKENMTAPTTLRRQAVHFSLCDAVICNDTGIMHLCASVSTPLVGIFGPTDPACWKPVGEQFIAVRSPDHQTASIEVENVFSALKTLLL